MTSTLTPSNIRHLAAPGALFHSPVAIPLRLAVTMLAERNIGQPKTAPDRPRLVAISRIPYRRQRGWGYAVTTLNAVHYYYIVSEVLSNLSHEELQVNRLLG